jgi:ABC-type uncharacterized transport system permease subunit
MELFLISGLKSSIFIGIIYGIGTIGLSLIYKYLRFPDFTTIASMIFGGLVCIKYGEMINVPVGIVLGCLAGSFLGLITSLQINLGKVPEILAGIITGIGTSTIGFFITNKEASISFSEKIRPSLDLFISNTFTWHSLIYLIIISYLICRLISWFFTTKLGLLTLALAGSDQYLKFRHGKIPLTKTIIIVLGNSIIGFAGALAAIQNGSVYVLNGHPDFLIIALGGYAFSIFAIAIISKHKMKLFLRKENKLNSPWYTKAILLLTGNIYLNDEEPKKILSIQIFYIIFSILILLIFRTVENEIGQEYNFILKASFLCFAILLSNMTERLSTI